MSGAAGVLSTGGVSERPRPPEELLARTSPVVLAYLEALEARRAEQDARIAAPEARLRQDSTTSSRPPSSAPPGTQAQRRAPPPPAPAEGKRRRGGQPGQPGHHRSPVAEERIDRLVLVEPEACRGRGTALPAAGADDPAAERGQMVELPAVRAVVTEYRLAARRCSARGVVTRAARPAEAGGGSFGPRLQAAAGLLGGRSRLSRREAVQGPAELGEIELSLGAVARLEQATGTALAPIVDEGAAAGRGAAAANLDETGWWQGRRRTWLWTTVTEVLTLCRLDPSRGGKVVRELLGPDWGGIVGSDRWSAYRWLPLEQRQLCRAHLVREFRELATSNQHQAPLGQRLPDVSQRVFAQWDRFRAEAIDRPTLQAELAPLQTELRRALEAGLKPPFAIVGGLCANLLELWPARWTFAVVDGVEPTNNAAERALRPAVRWRKGSFGSQSDAGSRFVERLLTVAASCKQPGRGLLDFLAQAITAARLGLPPPSLVPATTG